ncbi:hypothetical protein TWF730_008002 [Orbilia blumenaviensis]|uniref:Complex III subunit 9 n=1 Tax=Orbilia blumenaviensis TaxID=1796055 RepID=A0AAV9VC77_9PEZI
MSLAATIYNNLFRRNFVMVGAVMGGAFAADIAFDVYSQRFWDWKNQGRQWKDIRQKYLLSEDD